MLSLVGLLMNFLVGLLVNFIPNPIEGNVVILFYAYHIYLA